MYQIFISGYRLAEVTHGKPYYVYSIEMIHSINGTRHYIEKRYSEFNALHRLVIYIFCNYLNVFNKSNKKNKIVFPIIFNIF